MSTHQDVAPSYPDSRSASTESDSLVHAHPAFLFQPYRQSQLSTTCPLLKKVPCGNISTYTVRDIGALEL